MVKKDFWKNRRVLVTGHTGFKGAWLSLWLNSMGAEVIGFSLPAPTNPSLYELAGIKVGINSIIGDIRDFDYLKKTILAYKPEIVFHLAAQSLVRRSYQEPIETYSTNIMGTVNLFEALRQNNRLRAIINVTSDKCYENNEWIWGYRENDPMGGYDPYSSSKGCAELITSAYRQSFFNPEHYSDHGVALASVRAGNVIGGGDFAEDRLIPDMVRAFIEKDPVKIRYPEATRPWQHVLEPLAGYLLLGRKLYEHGQRFIGPWNFGPNDTDAKSVRWIVDKFAEYWGDGAIWDAEKEVQPHEAFFLRLDCSKAKSLLGWTPRMDINTALKWTSEWYKIYKNSPQSVKEITLKQISEYNEILG
ncbi:CDP-glucose 4,6-dehydratase [Thermodesulfobacteriota bacterium]